MSSRSYECSARYLLSFSLFWCQNMSRESRTGKKKFTVQIGLIKLKLWVVLSRVFCFPLKSRLSRMYRRKLVLVHIPKYLRRINILKFATHLMKWEKEKQILRSSCSGILGIDSRPAAGWCTCFGLICSREVFWRREEASYGDRQTGKISSGAFNNSGRSRKSWWYSFFNWGHCCSSILLRTRPTDRLPVWKKGGVIDPSENSSHQE